MQKGDQYHIPISITFGKDSEVITPENVDEVAVKIGNVVHKYPNGGLTFDNDKWFFPITNIESYKMNFATFYQVRIKRNDNIVHSAVGDIHVLSSIIKVEE